MKRYLNAIEKRDRVRCWLRRHKRSQEWLANELGISGPLLSLILDRRRVPQLRTAYELERITGVPARTWADHPLRRSRRRVAA